MRFCIEIVTPSEEKPMSDIQKLLDVMRRLRDPQSGCPWDVAQDFKSIAPYTIEEAYEVAEAIEQGDLKALKEELGDLLLQVAFHARMAEEAGHFDFNDVVNGIAEKMIRRHPHVFGDAQAASPEDVDKIWAAAKKTEKNGAAESALDGIPSGVPPMIRAQKLQHRAAKVGFEWTEAAHVLDKLEEETAEMREALASGSKAEMEDELGDLFFVLVNFGRMLGFDCDNALRHANQKFERRFRGMELDIKAENENLEQAGLDKMEAYWQKQKLKERRN